MPTDFTVSLFHRPGTLAAASAALGQAGINIEGACAFVCGETGVYHLLVSDAERGRRALIDAGFDILAERRVVLHPVGIDRAPQPRCWAASRPPASASTSCTSPLTAISSSAATTRTASAARSGEPARAGEWSEQPGVGECELQTSA